MITFRLSLTFRCISILCASPAYFFLIISAAEITESLNFETLQISAESFVNEEFRSFHTDLLY